MIAESTVKIIKDICEAMGRSENDCSQWEVGFTADPERHLFTKLAIPRDSRWCIYRCASSASEAQAIVNAFWNFECKRCPLSSETRQDESAVYVFAYLKGAPREGLTIESRAWLPPSPLWADS